MDQYSYIRTAVRVYKTGIRELSKETGHSRVTIRKVLREEARGYSNRQHQFYPVLAGYLKIIDGWLEGDRSEPRKQRHTARRIYHRLVNEHGYAGSEEAVRRYVRLTKPRLGLDGSEVFVITDPECGREAEVDWGRAGAVIRGVKTPIYYFCMRSRFSGKPFVRAYSCEKQQAFFDGHIHAFAFFGGVFPTLVYDNLKSAVQKILSGRGRVEQESFQRFRAYYTFEARFSQNSRTYASDGLLKTLSGSTMPRRPPGFNRSRQRSINRSSVLILPRGPFPLTFGNWKRLAIGLSLAARTRASASL